MARRTKAWLTPDTGDTSVIRGCLEIPAPLLPMVTGALSALTEVWNWQAFGTMTPEDAAEAATRMLFAFEDGTCSDMNCEDVLDCVLPYLQANLYDDATIRLEPTTEQPQVSYDGGTTWTDIPQSGNGTINAPQPTPTSGANDDAKICLASSRAALVIAEFYKQTFGAFTANVMNALGTANSFLQDIKMALFNAIYSPYDGIVEAAGFLEQDFETNYTAGELSETNIEDLLCLLVLNASVDDSGVVTFDYGSVRDNVIADVGSNPGTALWFLLGNMQGAGLNAAGSTRITDAPMDCTPCQPPWCYQHVEDFSGTVWPYIGAKQVVDAWTSWGDLTPGLFAPASVSSGDGNPAPSIVFPATGTASMQVVFVAFDEPYFLEYFSVNRRVVNAGSPLYHVRILDSDNVWQQFAAANAGSGWVNLGFNVNQVVRGIAIGNWGSNAEASRWDNMVIRLSGLGDNPFGANNC